MTFKRTIHINYNLVLFALLCFFTIDGVFHLTRQLPSFGIGMREWFFVIMIGMSIPFLLKNDCWFANKYSVSIFLMILVIITSVIRAYIGSQTMEYVMDLIYEFIYYFYFYILLLAIKKEKQLRFFVGLILGLGSLLSALSIFVELSNIIIPSLCYPVVELSDKLEFLNVYNQYGIVTRIMWTGVVFQIIALFLSICFYIEKGSGKYIVLLILNAIGILFTYSRGIIAGVAIGVFFFLFMHSLAVYRKNIRVIKLVLYGIIALLLLVFVLSIKYSDLIGFFFERFSLKETSTSNSDSLRSQMVKMLNNLIAQKPIFGGGAGAHINLRDGRVEMTYHDIISKMGFVGLIVFFLPLLYLFLDYSRELGNDSFTYIKLGLISALIAVIVSSYSNPSLLGSLGLLLYCLCMRLFVGGSNELKDGLSADENKSY